MWGNRIFDNDMLEIHKIDVYSIASEFDIFLTGLNLICLYLLHILSK